MEGVTTLHGGQPSPASGTTRRGILLVIAHKGMKTNVECAVAGVITVKTVQTIIPYILLIVSCL